MIISTGIIYGVLGCLVFCYTDAQPIYRVYTTQTGNNLNANGTQGIEVSIPSVSELVKNLSIRSSDDKAVSVIYVVPSSQYQTGPNNPYSPPSNYEYGQAANNPQLNYDQQQQLYEFNKKDFSYKLQQYEREQMMYEQNLREYYARFPSAIPITITASITPNEYKPTKPVPIPDGGKSVPILMKESLGFGKEQTLLTPKKQPSNEEGSTEGGDQTTPSPEADLSKLSVDERIERIFIKTPSPELEAPKTSLNDQTGNVFKDKPKTSTAEAPEEMGDITSIIDVRINNEIKTKLGVPRGDDDLQHGLIFGD